MHIILQTKEALNTLSNPILNLMLVNMKSIPEARIEVMSWTMINALVFISYTWPWDSELPSDNGSSLSFSQVNYF